MFTYVNRHTASIIRTLLSDSQQLICFRSDELAFSSANSASMDAVDMITNIVRSLNMFYNWDVMDVLDYIWIFLVLLHDFKIK
jgi:hypothetical protein